MMNKELYSFSFFLMLYRSLKLNEPNEHVYVCVWPAYLFCSSNLARSSSSSGLRFSESAGETAGAESAASWELESGLSTGLPTESGSASGTAGEPRFSSWTDPVTPPSFSGLLLGLDMTTKPKCWVQVKGQSVSVDHGVTQLGLYTEADSYLWNRGLQRKIAPVKKLKRQFILYWISTKVA